MTANDGVVIVDQCFETLLDSTLPLEAAKRVVGGSVKSIREQGPFAIVGTQFGWRFNRTIKPPHDQAR